MKSSIYSLFSIGGNSIDVQHFSKRTCPVSESNEALAHVKIFLDQKANAAIQHRGKKFCSKWVSDFYQKNESDSFIYRSQKRINSCSIRVLYIGNMHLRNSDMHSRLLKYKFKTNLADFAINASWRFLESNSGLIL